METLVNWITLVAGWLKDAFELLLGSKHAKLIVSLVRDAAALLIIALILRGTTELLELWFGEADASWIEYVHQGLVVAGVVALVVRSVREMYFHAIGDD